MKRLIYFVMTIMLLLPGCAPTTEIPVSTDTVTPSLTSTNTPLTPATKSPTEAPVIPSATFAPIEVVPVPASPFTLTEFNAGTEMKRLNVIGTGTAHGIEFSLDGKRLAIATGRGVFLYDGTTFEQNGFIDVNDSVSAIAFSPDGSVLAVAVDGKASLWNVKSGQHMMNLDGELVSIYKLAYGLGGYVVATLTYSGQVEIYDIQTGELIQKLNLDCCEIKGFNFAPNQKTFATIDTNLLRLWDLQTGKVIYEVDLKEDFSGPITFSPDGSSVFLTHVGEDYVLELDLQSGKNIYQGQNSYAYNYADPFAVENYHFNTQGDLVMLGYEKNGDDNYPSFRDVATDEKIILPYSAYSAPLFLEAFSFSSDGKYVAFGNPTDIFVWNIETLKLQSKLSGHDSRGADGWFGKIRSVDFNPQSNLLVSVGWDGTIRLWNARFGNELRRLNICCSVDFTPDGRYLITYGNGVAYVWGIP